MPTGGFEVSTLEFAHHRLEFGTGDWSRGIVVCGASFHYLISVERWPKGRRGRDRRSGITVDLSCAELVSVGSGDGPTPMDGG